MSFWIFTRETRVPTTPAHQQRTAEIITCLSRLYAGTVTTAAPGPVSLLGAL
jgi:hypothetical protein